MFSRDGFSALRWLVLELFSQLTMLLDLDTERGFVGMGFLRQTKLEAFVIGLQSKIGGLSCDLLGAVLLFWFCNQFHLPAIITGATYEANCFLPDSHSWCSQEKFRPLNCKQVLTIYEHLHSRPCYVMLGCKPIDFNKNGAVERQLKGHRVDSRTGLETSSSLKHMLDFSEMKTACTDILKYITVCDQHFFIRPIKLLLLKGYKQY